MSDNLLSFIKKQKIPNINFDALRYVLKKNLLNDQGLVLEFGTWKGQTLDMISEFTKKDVYGFDTFEGVNTQWGEVDMNVFNINGIPNKLIQLDKNTRYKTTGVKKDFNNNVHFIKGFFQDTVYDFLKDKNEKITFLHIDCDIYEGAKAIFDNCNKYIANDCIIVFDELVNYYGFEDGEYKAFYNWVKKNNIEYEWIGMNGKVLSLEEINFINDLEFNCDYTKFIEMDWFKKAKILNINFSVAVKIKKNPSFYETNIE